MGELEERHLAQLLHGLAGERAELRVGVDELAVGGQDRLRNRVLQEHHVVVDAAADRPVADLAHRATRHVRSEGRRREVPRRRAPSAAAPSPPTPGSGSSSWSL